VCKNI